jgi:hypothetical protein
MFCISSNVVQVDGSIITFDQQSNLLTSSHLPISEIVSSLREYSNECYSEVAVQSAIEAVVQVLEGDLINNLLIYEQK